MTEDISERTSESISILREGGPVGADGFMFLCI
jgi:hypothetical protein